MKAGAGKPPAACFSLFRLAATPCKLPVMPRGELFPDISPFETGMLPLAESRITGRRKELALTPRSCHVPNSSVIFGALTRATPAWKELTTEPSRYVWPSDSVDTRK